MYLSIKGVYLATQEFIRSSCDAMTTSTTTSLVCPARLGAPLDSVRFDWLMGVVSIWLLAGLFLDGWAHNTFLDGIETFLTPWHAVLYGGFTAVALILMGTALRNRTLGYAWSNALPQGYMPALAGVLIFALAGTADFAWHSWLGFEANQEALLSPPHLALAIGGGLILSAPFRAAWTRSQQKDRPGWIELLPALLSLGALMSVATFFTQYANVFQHANILTGPHPAGDTYLWDTTALAGVLIPTGIVMTGILLAVRRWQLPFGSLTILLTANTSLMFLMGQRYSGQHWPILLAALAGGLIGDGLLAALRPSPTRSGALRWFAFVVPFEYFLLFFGTLLLTANLWWRPHLWLGAPVLAGFVGLGLSYLLAPLPLSATAQSKEASS